MKMLALIIYTLLVFSAGIIFHEFTSSGYDVGLSFGFFIGLFTFFLIYLFASIVSEWINKSEFKWLDVFFRRVKDYKFDKK